MFTVQPSALEWQHVEKLSRTKNREVRQTSMGDVTQQQADMLAKAFDEYADAIYRDCYFRVFRRERAEELVQETFSKVWQYMLDGHEIINVRAFLYRVANNLIVDESRKKKEASLEALEESGMQFSESNIDKLEAHVDAIHILERLDSLNDAHRSVIIMRYVDELEPEEIARITGESANTISVRLHRAMKQLKEQFSV
jgi:RNA polymerase sigma-70 factor (ECF subfamily)